MGFCNKEAELITRWQVRALHLSLLLLPGILFVPFTRAQTKINPNQLPTTVGFKYASASAYRYVDGAGSDSSDGLSPGTAYATPQKCNTVVIGLGGGTCDMRTLYTYTSATEIDCGDAAGHPVICLLPPGNSGGTPSWNSNVSDGVSYGLKGFNNSSVIGLGPGLGAPFQIATGSSANLGAVCGNDTSVANAHIVMQGFTCSIFGGSPTVVKAIGLFSGLGDNAIIQNMTFDGLSGTATFSKVLWVNNSCCKTTFNNVNADAFSITGVTPCFFGNGTTGPNLTITFHGSCVHAGNGASNIVDQEKDQFGANTFTSYMESGTSTDTTTAKVSIQAFGSPTAADIFTAMNAAGDIALSTRYTFDIASGAHAIIIGAEQGNISTNAVNDHNPGRSPVTAAVNTSFSYSTEPNFQVGPSTLVSPALTGTPTVNGVPIAGGFTSTNVSPVMVNANTTSDQNGMAITVTAGALNSLSRSLLVQLAGVYSTPVASTAILTHKLKLCTVSGCGSGTVLTLATWTTSALGGIQATNNPYNATLNTTTQTAGASATFETHGNLMIDLAALASAAEAIFADNNTATVGTIDSTVQLFLQHTVAFSAASASNSATDRQLIADSVD